MQHISNDLSTSTSSSFLVCNSSSAIYWHHPQQRAVLTSVPNLMLRGV